MKTLTTLALLSVTALAQNRPTPKCVWWNHAWLCCTDANCGIDRAPQQLPLLHADILR